MRLQRLAFDSVKSRSDCDAMCCFGQLGRSRKFLIGVLELRLGFRQRGLCRLQLALAFPSGLDVRVVQPCTTWLFVTSCLLMSTSVTCGDLDETVASRRR